MPKKYNKRYAVYRLEEFLVSEGFRVYEIKEGDSNEDEQGS